jgi:hypothetical protein
MCDSVYFGTFEKISISVTKYFCDRIILLINFIQIILEVVDIYLITTIIKEKFDNLSKNKSLAFSQKCL